MKIANCLKLQGPALALTCLAVISCGEDQKPRPVLPEDFELRYKNDHLFRQNDLFSTTIPEFYRYKAPHDSNDCAKGFVFEDWRWQLDGEDPNEDYLELTISDYIGVEPGKSRAYTLTHYGVYGTSTYYLVARQKSGSGNLHFMKWRISINALEDLANESGDGDLDAAPPIGTPGFPRAWLGNSNEIGGEWVLSPGDAYDLRGITATLHVEVNNGGVKVCP